MFQVVYEQQKEWPETGPLIIEAPAICAEIAVSPDVARRKVNRYLVTYVSMTTHATEPTLVFKGDRFVWRLSIAMRLPEVGHVATLGSVDVDAVTQEIIPLSATQIRTIQDHANDIITRLAPAATEASRLSSCLCCNGVDLPACSSKL
ncbi:MAG: hypothetical protein R3E79_42090 [Caldilineaceae bacterium]